LFPATGKEREMTEDERQAAELAIQTAYEGTLEDSTVSRASLARLVRSISKLRDIAEDAEDLELVGRLDQAFYHLTDG
jgi:hypothetical protein